MDETFMIDLKAETKAIIKIGFVFMGFLIMLAVAAFLFMAFTIITDITVLAIFLISAAILFFYISKKYFQNVFYKEQITIEGDKLTVSNKSWGTEKIHEFNINDIKFFGHVGMREYTEHPMNNSIVDFTGLATGERELQFLIDDGTIEIETEDEVLRFGKNMSSWDTEEVIAKIEKYTNRKFSNKNEETSFEENGV
ncbi:MAG: hypothetical protein JNM51_02830 [Bacteroidia bacterium]|nr:hypothetical protein [Bacteroidia bacterium]